MLRLIYLVSILALFTVSAQAERRVALVVGNASYQYLQDLPNAANDARSVAQVLQRLGFQVITGIDLTNQGFRAKLVEFQRALKSADVALVFYAGHGIGVSGDNYLIPVDARLETADSLALETMPLALIRLTIERRPITSIIFFDACRNDPFIDRVGRSLGYNMSTFTGGWGAAKAPRGSFITFATSPGELALDGVHKQKNSPFTTALLENIERPDTDIEIMMRDVRARVKDLTKTDDRKAQQVWTKTSLTAGFRFAPSNKRSLKDWMHSPRRKVPVGTPITLRIKPPYDCRLTLVNVDNKGRSCILYPHAGLPEKVLPGGQVTMFPPAPHELVLNEVGVETFVAMCDASPAAISSATRTTRVEDCAAQPADEVFNDVVHELSTLRLKPKAKPGAAAKTSDVQTRRMLRSTLTVEVVAK